MLELLGEAGHWSLVAALMTGFIAMAGHLTGLIVLPRAWKVVGLVVLAALLLLAAIADRLR
ncbi:hypothetical protein [Bradyrhizobium stylosanthis]|uniref:Uncharacterized protein n=1 Tax=Bradyrhizobium stylosanthis TaxID=1803665 RepID=A0A560DPY2_9BRAD|nr:hypothetical protein [Bradyrhizobium stylosanthis]TWA99176.1 hypothetical protein FBZ96_104148 [Bradyrhizobium stylosanthis]